jgi:cell volume regulation protein A
VLACLIPFRVPWRHQAFISWAGLRGAVPIVLATFPIVAGVPGSGHLLNIVFVLVVVFTLIQGPALPPLARALGVIQPDQAREVDIESAPLDVLDAELLTLTVPAGSRLHGVEVAELRLPAPAVISLVIRDRATFVPAPETGLREGDTLLIVATGATREAAERRLRAVGRQGRLARWYGEQGGPDPARLPGRAEPVGGLRAPAQQQRAQPQQRHADRHQDRAPAVGERRPRQENYAGHRHGGAHRGDPAQHG